MARLWPVLAAVARATFRKRSSALGGNNILYVALTLLMLGDDQGSVFLLGILAVLLFLPSSGDPLRVIPADRLALMPLSQLESIMLRILSPWLNPVIATLGVLLLWRKITLGLWAILAGLLAVGFLSSSLRLRGWSLLYPWVPAPRGRFEQILRKDGRQLVSTLDFYGALLVALPAVVARIAGQLPIDAHIPLTVLVVLMISTYTQSVFGLDGFGGLVRYRLLPLRGWQILITKYMPFLIVTAALTAPLSPGAGMCCALLVAAAGQYPSVVHPRRESKWLFHTSASFFTSIVQLAALAAGAAGYVQFGFVFTVPCLAVYLASIWWCGRLFEITR